MMIKKAALVLMLFSPSIAYACFNNAGCGAGNICVKTGNILGVCVSTAETTVVNPVTGTATTTTTLVPAGTYPVNTTVVPAAGTTISPTTTTTTVTPSATTTVIGTPSSTPIQTSEAAACATNLQCPTGYACVRTVGQYYGACTRIAE